MKSPIKVNKYDIYPSKNITEYDDTKSPFFNLFTHNNVVFLTIFG